MNKDVVERGYMTYNHGTVDLIGTTGASRWMARTLGSNVRPCSAKNLEPIDPGCASSGELGSMYYHHLSIAHSSPNRRGRSGRRWRRSYKTSGQDLVLSATLALPLNNRSTIMVKSLHVCAILFTLASPALASGIMVPLYLYPANAPACTAWKPLITAYVTRRFHSRRH